MGRTLTKTKIGWTDSTWNCVIGCSKNPPCPYCYAHRMNKRFHFVKDYSKPEWIELNFQKKFPIKPKRIFVNSMSDIMFWKPRWMERVLKKIKEYPQHTFQFLTKFPEVYREYDFPENCWLGITITKNIHIQELNRIAVDTPYNFISIEPIQEKIDFDNFLFEPDWIIIGFQTNPLKYIKKEYISNIIEHARRNLIPLFLKDSIYKVYPDLPEIREFPK